MGLFPKEIQLVEKPKQHNKTNNVKTKSLNVCGAIRERLDENNTLTVEQPVVVNESQNKSQYWITLN